MFIEFYYVLRDMKIPVSITEFLSLMEVIDKGLVRDSMEFYYTARSLLVKDEKYFDAFDQAYSFYFKDTKVPDKLKEELMKWLEKPAPDMMKLLRQYYSQEELDKMKGYDFETLRKMFEERMKEQTEEHNGGNYWIGTKGKSPFGWGGAHPLGIRVAGWGGGGMAAKIAEKRYFKNYRSDVILDTRQIQMALRKLRKLSRIGAPDELNLNETIRQTCKQGGEIEFIWEKRKKNNLKLLLLMDVGGSMDPFSHMVEQLFSAANKSTHFKEFKYFYFHNCIYDKIYEDMELEKKIPTVDFLKKFDSDFRVILVGDAAMAPYELIMRYGAIDYFQLNDTPGLEWLNRVRKHFPKSVWLNPEVVGPYISESRKMISRVFPMHQLSLDGLDEAIKILI